MCIECGFTLKRVRDMTRTYSQVKKCLRFDIILKLETIHGRTFRNKTKKAVLAKATFKVSTPARSQRQ